MTKYILSLALILSMSSCFNDRIDLDLNEGSEKLVITAWISDLDEAQFVTITKSVNFLGDDPPVFVSDATVMLSDESTDYELEYVSKGEYYLPDNFQAQVGDFYKLDVNYNNTTYYAEDTMRACPQIDDLKLKLYTPEEPDSIEMFFPIFSIQEIPGEGDGYLGIDYQKGNTTGKIFTRGIFTDDEFIDGEYLEDVELGGDLYIKGDTIVVDIYSIGAEAARYLSDIDAEIFRDGPFDPPPANIRTNISGDAIGYFMIGGAQRMEIVVE